MSARNPRLLGFDDGGDYPESGHLTTEVTLRDLFAMAAVSSGCLAISAVSEHVSPEAAFRVTAAEAYALADAMLAERAR